MYQLHASKSGITVDATAKTLAGAKQEASAWITFGGGNVTVLKDGCPLYIRRFWQDGNRFGWEKWEEI